MIYKQDYYQGVAVLQVIGDPRYVGIRKHEYGFIVNDNIFFLVKYTTKPRSPWRFAFTQDELDRTASLIGSYRRLVVAFVCGGDGICALGWGQIEDLMGFDPGWIAVRRGFSGSYGVWGPLTALKRKIPLKGWPDILFGKVAEELK
jgi:hypothetical protein